MLPGLESEHWAHLPEYVYLFELGSLLDVLGGALCFADLPFEHDSHPPDCLS